MLRPLLLALLMPSLMVASLFGRAVAAPAPNASPTPSRSSAMLPVVHPRDGLPNVFHQLRAGRPVTVLWFGGSITAGAGASDGEKTSYRALTGDWFKTAFPKAVVTNVNAAIGGTGSDLGAFRTRRDALAAKPDLVVVEYAVNDGGAPGAMILRGMEGIVRQIRRANPSTDICFVYTFVVGQAPQFKAGDLPNAIQRDEEVAAHYGIPSVNMAVPAAQRLNDGTMTAEAFSKDGVHPTDAGYRIYADTLIGYLKEADAAHAKPRRHSLPRPLRADSLEHARMIPPDAMGALGDGWTVETTRPVGDFPQLLVASRPGAETTLPFSGSILSMFYVLGPDTGAFDYRVDGGDWSVMDPFDAWSSSYRAHYRNLADGLSDGPHTITLRIRAEHNPDSKGTVTRIGYLLTNPGR